VTILEAYFLDSQQTFLCVSIFAYVVPPRGQAGAGMKPFTPVCSLAATSGDGLLTLFSYSTEKHSVNTSWSDPLLW